MQKVFEAIEILGKVLHFAQAHNLLTIVMTSANRWDAPKKGRPQTAENRLFGEATRHLAIARALQLVAHGRHVTPFLARGDATALLRVLRLSQGAYSDGRGNKRKPTVCRPELILTRIKKVGQGKK